MRCLIILFVVIFWWLSCFYFLSFCLLYVPLWVLFFLLLLCSHMRFLSFDIVFSVFPSVFSTALYPFLGFAWKSYFVLHFVLNFVLLFCTSSDHLLYLTWIMPFFNIPFICFCVNLFLYFLYPHLEVILFFFCFSVFVTRTSFSSISLWSEYVSAFYFHSTS